MGIFVFEAYYMLKCKHERRDHARYRSVMARLWVGRWEEVDTLHGNYSIW